MFSCAHGWFAIQWIENMLEESCQGISLRALGKSFFETSTHQNSFEIRIKF
jgi:hypothetical protein